MDKKISFKNYKSGLLIYSKNHSSIFKLKRNEIIYNFEKKGFLLFRGFKLNSKNLTKFTDKFTKIYANDAKRRKIVLNSKKIHDVDYGYSKMPLHSEASYSPSWPEIIWFFCIKPPKKSGWTTICDGEKVYSKMSVKSKKFFLSYPIKYNLKIPFGKDTENKNYKKKLRDWFIEQVGVENCKIDMQNKYIYLQQKRYALNQSRNLNKLAFANHMQIYLDRDPQLQSWEIKNRKKIPMKIKKELKKIFKKFTEKIKWQKGDLCMIDNRRYMHGRTKITKKDKFRKIYNIQSLQSNFGYGIFSRSN